jgi:hypothetical protein
VSQVIITKLSANAIEKSRTKQQVRINEIRSCSICRIFVVLTVNKGSGVDFTLSQMPLGFDTGEIVINEAAKVLRLLYIQDLRVLQTKINETIVAVQSLVADPRTDSKLGKIGW